MESKYSTWISFRQHLDITPSSIIQLEITTNNFIFLIVLRFYTIWCSSQQLWEGEHLVGESFSSVEEVIG